MEAARLNPLSRRTGRLDRELDGLRPFGEAYLMRNFGEKLAHADVEDSVSDVTLRLHRQIAAGRPPDNLQAAFLTGCRNAAIDRLRLRARKPTVAIEAAADTPTDLPAPDQLAERRETSARTREVMARLRPRQRQVLMLRFGADLTVPEIAEQMQVSLPAAKNLLGRSVEQARRRFEAIEDREFCPDVQHLLRGAVIDRELAEVAGEDERRVLQAHLDHCGACKSFLSDLHRNLHEIGSGAVLSATAIHGSRSAHPGAWFDHALNGLHSAVDRARLTAYKLSGAFGSDSSGTAGGALAGTGQKVVAVCGAATATTATCLATGIVGPGVGVLDHHHSDPVAHHHAARAAQVRRLSELPAVAPEPEPEATPTPEPTPTSAGEGKSSNQPPPPPEPEPMPTPAQQSAEEFGVESTAPPPEPEPAPEPAPAPSAPAPKGAGSGGGGGGETFGFGG